MKTGISVRDAMTTKPVVATQEESIQDCAKKMYKNKVGSILIVQDTIPLGIISEKDIIEKVVSKAIDPSKVKAKNIMVKHLITISPDADLAQAIDLMAKEEIRKLPVVEGKKFLGLITSKDVLKIEPSLFEILSTKYEILKEEQHKPIRYVEGVCSNCGTRGPIYRKGKKLLCPSCIEKF